MKIQLRSQSHPASNRIKIKIFFTDKINIITWVRPIIGGTGGVKYKPGTRDYRWETTSKKLSMGLPCMWLLHVIRLCLWWLASYARVACPHACFVLDSPLPFLMASRRRSLISSCFYNVPCQNQGGCNQTSIFHVLHQHEPCSNWPIDRAS